MSVYKYSSATLYGQYTVGTNTLNPTRWRPDQKRTLECSCVPKGVGGTFCSKTAPFFCVCVCVCVCVGVPALKLSVMLGTLKNLSFLHKFWVAFGGGRFRTQNPSPKPQLSRDRRLLGASPTRRPCGHAEPGGPVSR